MVVCQSACGSAGITANVKALAMLGIRKYKSSNKNK